MLVFRYDLERYFAGLPPVAPLDYIARQGLFR